MAVTTAIIIIKCPKITLMALCVCMIINDAPVSANSPSFGEI